MKYRLKKGTPEFKAGEVFEMIHNIDVGDVLTQNAPRQDMYAFEVDSIDNFDEWFEEVKESNPLFGELTHDDRKDRVAVNIWFRKNRDGGHPKKMVNFIQFMEAINVVSQDEGFMTRQLDGTGWAVCLKYDGELGTTIIDERLASSFCFEWRYDAGASMKKHPDEWRTILNYDWGKE